MYGLCGGTFKLLSFESNWKKINLRNFLINCRSLEFCKKIIFKISIQFYTACDWDLSIKPFFVKRVVFELPEKNVSRLKTRRLSTKI